MVMFNYLNRVLYTYQKKKNTEICGISHIFTYHTNWDHGWLNHELWQHYLYSESNSEDANRL